MSGSTAYIAVSDQFGGELFWYAQSSAGIHETINGWLGEWVADRVAGWGLTGLMLYDNGPEVSVAESIHARAEVRFQDTEALDQTRYRKRGSLRIVLRAPVALGDGALRELAETIRADLQGATVPVDVVLGAPGITASARSGGWYTLAVDTPWWHLESVDLPAVSGVGVAGNWEDAANVIRARFAAAVGSVPVTYDNAPAAGHTDTVWARLAILQGSGIRSERGEVWATPGVAAAQVFAPLRTGTGALYNAVDLIYEGLRGTSDQGVAFRVPNCRTVGVEADGAFFQANVDCPFVAYQHT